MLLLSKYICLETLYQVCWKSGESHFWVGLMETKKHILLLDDLLSMTAWKSVYIMIGGLFDSNELWWIFVKIRTVWFFFHLKVVSFVGVQSFEIPTKHSFALCLIGIFFPSLQSLSKIYLAFLCSKTLCRYKIILFPNPIKLERTCHSNPAFFIFLCSENSANQTSLLMINEYCVCIHTRAVQIVLNVSAHVLIGFEPCWN
jgi:hypothetical protein